MTLQLRPATRIGIGAPRLDAYRKLRFRSLIVMLRVTEIFRSIQGESTHAGRPCTFVRLTGCPMRCTWCDSEYTFTGGEHISIEEGMKQVRDLCCQPVEVTGRGPLGQRRTIHLIKDLGGA